MTFTCRSCGGECKYAVAPAVCPFCMAGGPWHDRDETAQPTTAYDRDQQALRATVKSHDSVLEQLVHRLNAALQRIEQLEADVARLKGPRPEQVGVNSATLVCGCVDRCMGHQFQASPATAYPPLPDEET